MDKYSHIIYILTITTKKETRTIISNDLIGIKQKINNRNKKFTIPCSASIYPHRARRVFFHSLSATYSWLMKIHRQPKFDKEREKAALERVASSRRFASVAVVALGRKLSV